jgi:orotate phosphoribosyltransferase
MSSSENQLIAQTISKMLLEIRAIKLSPDKPFTWASGWNSPIYCDNRLTLSYPKVRTFIKHAFADLISDKFPRAEAIAGVATAGIPQGALVADVLGLPFLYVRPEAKKHGLGNLIEGKLEPNTQVVLIEDLVSTGGSSLKSADAIIEAGGKVLGMAAIFSYGFGLADENFAKKNIKLYTLSSYNSLIEEASKLKFIQESHLESLSSWRESPSTWMK